MCYNSLVRINKKGTHSLTDKTPDSGSGAGGSIPSGCIGTIENNDSAGGSRAEPVIHRDSVSDRNVSLDKERKWRIWIKDQKMDSV